MRTLLLLHGRGADIASILPLAQALGADDWQVLAPQAPGHTWYPYSFLAPVQQNQPFLAQALNQLDQLLQPLNSQQVAILGFSQGACLALEYAARHPRRYGAVMALTGGLIGDKLNDDYPGDLAGTPIFLGSGDPDGHVPFSRVEESARLLSGQGASLEMRRYPGMPHTINDDELNYCRRLLKGVPQ